MGNLMRQYWIPFLQSADLPEKDGAPLRVRLLGENLVAFRNTEGRVGLIDHVCPHRCASLFFARNEENGLRCLYHGWKFDIEGRCLDIPNEPPGSNFNGQIRITAYPCVEQNGIVWTYLGPDHNHPPPLPELGWAMVEPKQRGALRYQRACNWLQAMEGDFDSSHLSFLHLAFDPKLQGTAENKQAGIDYYRNIARMDKQPLLEVQDTDVGVMYGARRDAEDGKFYWRVTQFMLPFYTSVPGFGGKNRDKVWVPLDDEHTMVWEPHWSSTRELSEEEQKAGKTASAPAVFCPTRMIGWGKSVSPQMRRTIICWTASGKKTSISAAWKTSRPSRTVQCRKAWARFATARRSILAHRTRPLCVCAAGCSTRPGNWKKIKFRRVWKIPRSTTNTAASCCSRLPTPGSKSMRRR